MSDWPALWALSAAVCGRGGLRAVKRRVRFMAEALRHAGPLRPFLHPRPGSVLQRAMAERPDTLGVLVWPFVCANWGAAERLRRVADHFETVEARAPVLDFGAEEQLLLAADLGEDVAGLRIVLDRPKWFMREGQLALNLFIGETRVYSLAFALASEGGRALAHVGAIQGVAAEGIQGHYKDLTKGLHGMRPRDFLVEAFRAFARSIGVQEILAVADASRQHRSRYFGAAKTETLTLLDYDEIWAERGGVRATPDFFRLAMEAPARNLVEVASKKRAMYRRRYELLDRLEARMRLALGEAAMRRPAPQPQAHALDFLPA